MPMPVRKIGAALERMIRSRTAPQHVLGRAPDVVERHREFLRFAKRVVATVAPDLEATSSSTTGRGVTAYIENRNRAPKPFVWTAAVHHLVDRVGKAKQTSSALQ